MKCYVHLDVDAFATCVSCGRAVCGECRVEVDGEVVCRECLAEGRAGPEAARDITDNDKMMGLLAYVVALIVPLIILLSETGNQRPFQRYHAVQSLAVSAAVFLITLLVGCFVCAPIAVVFELATGFLGTCCLIPLMVVPYVPMVYYGIRAYQGEYTEIPVLTEFMVQQGWLERP